MDSEKQHHKRYCPISLGQEDLCMGKACKWSVGGECAVALLARGVTDMGGGATDGNGSNEAAKVDR